MKKIKVYAAKPITKAQKTMPNNDINSQLSQIGKMPYPAKIPDK